MIIVYSTCYGGRIYGIPGIHVLVLAAYAAYSPGNIARSRALSNGTRASEEARRRDAERDERKRLHSSACVPTHHASHPKYPGCLMCRYTPCVISWCSRLRLVWIRCVNDGPAVTCAPCASRAEHREREPGDFDRARPFRALQLGRQRELERILQHRERHGDAVRRAEQEAVPGERGSVVRARDGVLGDVVHEQRPRERARLPRDEIHRLRRARACVERAGAFRANAPWRCSRREGRSARSVDPADALANARRRPGASDTVKLPATSCRREHRHVTNRLRKRENQQTPPPLPFCASRYLSCTALSVVLKNTSRAT